MFYFYNSPNDKEVQEFDMVVNIINTTITRTNFLAQQNTPTTP